MRAEEEIRKFLEKCGDVRGFGLSNGPCPLIENKPEDPDDEKLGCCAECSFPFAIQWVLEEGKNPTANGQDFLLEKLKEISVDVCQCPAGYAGTSLRPGVADGKCVSCGLPVK